MSLLIPTSRADGSILTATIYNADRNEIATYLRSDLIETPSDNVLATFQSTSDPGEVGSESLPASEFGEIQRLRNIIKEILGATVWYSSPLSSLKRLGSTVGIGFNASINIDASLGVYFEVGTLTGNITTFTLTNQLAGQQLCIRFKQDATGSRTVVTPTGAKITGSISGTPSVPSYLRLSYSSADARWEGAWTSVPA